jgi:AmmeMemoRadiSam system protein B
MGAMLRKAAVAGSWYPGTAEAITREVDQYLAAAAGAKAPGRLVALVSPHAGLRYSGPVAAYGYSLLRGRSAPVVVVVGPSHRAAFHGVAVQAHGEWETPLGRVAIDEAVAEALLAASPGLVFDDPGLHRPEHSLEMQMPFLQRLVPDLRLVPLMMGSQSRPEVIGLGEALGRALAGRDALLVASSDLSHYEPAAVADRLDAVVVEQVSRFDDEALLARLEQHDNVACGGGPIVAVMRSARALGADRATVMRHANSGDIAGDRSQVVGYLSAAFTASAS